MQMGHRARTIFFQSRPNPRELWPASERETLKPSGSARARACNRKRNRVPRGFLHPTSVIPHRRNRLDQPVTCVQPRTARVSASHLSAHVTRRQPSCLEHHKSTTMRRDPPYQRVMLAGVRSFGTPIYSPAAETPKAKPSRCTWARTACTCDMGERGNALDHQ